MKLCVFKNILNNKTNHIKKNNKINLKRKVLMDSQSICFLRILAICMVLVNP